MDLTFHSFMDYSELNFLHKQASALVPELRQKAKSLPVFLES